MELVDFNKERIKKTLEGLRLAPVAASFIELWKVGRDPRRGWSKGVDVLGGEIPGHYYGG